LAVLELKLVLVEEQVAPEDKPVVLLGILQRTVVVGLITILIVYRVEPVEAHIEEAPAAAAVLISTLVMLAMVIFQAAVEVVEIASAAVNSPQ
jgi:hypothetical protein